MAGARTPEEPAAGAEPADVPPRADPGQRTHAAGTVLAGKFRIVGVLGSGAMGTVYEIVHELTRHRRAMKVVHAQWADDDAVVERFLREATTAGRVGNRHVVETFDSGRLESGEPYLVMELLEGVTLSQRIAETGGLPVEELGEVVAQACEAVQAAHDAGIVHRALEPASLFIISGGGRPFVKILDFGISTFEPRRTQARSTAPGRAAAPLYQAPEQLSDAHEIDARADVYALGVILHEAACGRHPYPCDSIPALTEKIAASAWKKLHEARPSLPSALSDLAAAAMVKERGKRLASARTLADSLRVITRDASVDPLGRTLPVSDAPPSPLAPVSVSSRRAAAAATATPVTGTPATRSDPGAPRAAAASASTSSPPSPSKAQRSVRIAVIAIVVLVLGIAGGMLLGSARDDGGAPAPSAPP